jgi:hypothetical protein
MREDSLTSPNPSMPEPEDTVCPHCQAQSATRLLSASTAQIKGTRKPGFTEIKAYNMLDERMEKFAKLPPLMGKRAAPDAASIFRSLFRGHNGKLTKP